MPDAPTPAEITALLRLAMRHGDDPNVRACLEAVLGWLERQAPVLVDTTPGKRARRQIEVHHDTPYLTVRQVAMTLGYSTSKIYKLLNDKRIPAGRAPGGSAIRIRREDLNSFVEAMFGGGSPPAVLADGAEQSKPKRNAPVKTILRADGKPDFPAMAREHRRRQRQNAK